MDPPKVGQWCRERVSGQRWRVGEVNTKTVHLYRETEAPGFPPYRWNRAVTLSRFHALYELEAD